MAETYFLRATSSAEVAVALAVVGLSLEAARKRLRRFFSLEAGMRGAWGDACQVFDEMQIRMSLGKSLFDWLAAISIMDCCLFGLMDQWLD